MATSWEEQLARWQSAGLVDAAAAERIRLFEAGRDTRRAEASGWARLALALGACLLGAGVLLFVSAHWDGLSPGWRMAVAIAPVLAFHVAGGATMRRTPALSSALHVVGTVSLGAAIALAGQIFNIEEHWPSAVLLWAVGAAAAWVALGQWPQAALTAVLVPAWLASEWAVGASARQIMDHRPLSVGLWLTALTYLTARQDDDDGPVRRALGWIGGLAVIPFGVGLAMSVGAASTAGWAVIGWTVALLLPLTVAVALRGRRAWWNAIGAVWAVIVTAASAGGAGRSGGHPLMVYALCAVGAAGLVVWGIREQRPERINLGMAGFALTVTIFYFSDVMDKLGRSASLVGLGVLFLVGGWLLERTRRSLVAGLSARDAVAEGAP
jgi:hypothetical protein